MYAAGNSAIRRLLGRARHPQTRASESEGREEKQAEAAAEHFASRDRANDSGHSAVRDSGVSTAQAGGQPLPANLRGQYERFFGADLGNVRLGIDHRAARAARALGARAFALDDRICFGANQFQPATGEGRRLIAHEIAHTLQPAGKAVVHRQELPPEEQPEAEPAPFVWPPAPTADAADLDAAGDEPADPPQIDLHPLMPWFITVSGNTDPAAVSRELYGIDLSATGEVVTTHTFSLPVMGDIELRKISYPDLLTPTYRKQFDEKMQALVDADVDRAESILLQVVIDGDDEAELIAITSKWSERADVRTPDGGTYFDAFLSQLRNDSMHIDYGLWSSDSQSYFDRMFSEVEERSGELNTLVAAHSQKYGSYRPVWAQLEERAAAGTAPPDEVNEEVVARSTEMIGDALSGWTDEDDSKVISDTLVGLPSREKAEVLKRLMGQYDVADWTGDFGKFGEAWDGGMLYYLFEDLSEEDRASVGQALIDSGVMSEQAVASLAAGRGWGGKYLPVTTHLGHEAAEYWADVAVRNEDEWWSPAPIVMLGFASLWTPETAGSTVLTLGTAGAAPLLGALSPTVGRALLVGGTGVTAFTTTSLIIELSTGVDAEGNPLDETTKTAHLLLIVSNLLMLGAGFMAAAAPKPAPTEIVGPPMEAPILETPALGAGARGGMPMRVIGVSGEEYTVIAQNPATGEVALLRINVRTGNGTLLNAATGEGVPVNEWSISKPLPELPPERSNRCRRNQVRPPLRNWRPAR